MVLFTDTTFDDTLRHALQLQERVIFFVVWVLLVCDKLNTKNINY